MARDSARQVMEVELKLEFDPTETRRIASHPALDACLAPPEDHQLVTTYFDTPDGALHQAGVYLRIRENGGRYVQTVKTAKNKTDFLERLEWEREIPSCTLDLDGVAGSALEPLLTPALRAALQPVFETRMWRRLCRIAEDRSEIEVAIDVGEIATRSHTLPISELELELKRGDKAALFRLARRLAETVPFRLELKTKAERGYELLQDGGAQAEKATPADIPPGMAAQDAFRAIALSCLRQIMANEPSMSAGRPEALHQMRIGLRRLRASLAVFDEIVGDDDLAKIKTELRWITQELGPARDLDVFETEVLRPLRASRPEDEVIAASHRDVQQQRMAAYARAAAATRSSRFRGAMLRLAEWIETGPWTVDEERTELRARAVSEYAAKKLARLRKRIKRKGADLRHRSVSQRHRLRIRAKRLRYATEFFAATFPGAASAKRRTESLAALKDLQDALGGLNDLATRHALMVDSLGDKAKAIEQAATDGSQEDADKKSGTLLRKAEQAVARLATTKSFWKA
jgi:inorganic triphosphatase YgiF